MASGTITSMSEVSARLRADDTPTPPASSDPGNAMDISNPSTPTRQSFAGLPGQKPLPDDMPSREHLDKHHTVFNERAESIHPSQEHDDVDMGEADTETIAEDDEDGSDNDSVTSDSQRPNKKKKGQRFFCTDFPPCQLSFTRSEHLARHIRCVDAHVRWGKSLTVHRKHTGERPFQCHCSRRFSRLDNLRQHAQTVHVNEEIPGDSLAATSTRFQRQVRTDRVRASGSRSRGSTLSGPQTPGHARGHSRNLSTSSIGLVSSNFTLPDDGRRRPPALAIATDGLKRPHDMTEGDQQYYSQSGLTPTSQIMPTVVGSPYQSGYASPTSTISRSSYYGPPSHTRRLSVPSSSNPYQNSGGYASGYYTPISSQASVYASHQTSGYASPNGSIMSPGRRDSETEIEYRRRTWHPSSQTNYNQRPATSGLSYQQTPDEPMPSLTEQRAATQVTRLPGIESFDHAPRPPTDTIMLNAIARPGSSYDSGIQQGLNRLELNSNEQWQQANPPPSYPPPPAPRGYQHHHMSMPDVPSTPRQNKRRAWYGGPIGPTAFLQPPGSHRPSPEDSGSSDGGVRTPLTFQSQEYYPTIVSANDPLPPQMDHPTKAHVMQQPPMGIIHEKPTMPPRADSGLGPLSGGPMAAMAQQAPMHAYPLQAGHDARYAGNYNHLRDRPGPDMGRLEALVAVATSENRATEKQR